MLNEYKKLKARKDVLEKENCKLKARKDTLDAENCKLQKARHDVLKADNFKLMGIALKEENIKLEARNDAIEAENFKLKVRIAALEMENVKLKDKFWMHYSVTVNDSNSLKHVFDAFDVRFRYRFRVPRVRFPVRYMRRLQVLDNLLVSMYGTRKYMYGFPVTLSLCQWYEVITNGESYVIETTRSVKSRIFMCGCWLYKDQWVNVFKHLESIKTFIMRLSLHEVDYLLRI